VSAKKNRSFEGVVRGVPLGDGSFGFARALTFPIVEFYDYRSRDIPALELLRACPVLFRLWVARHAFTGRRWKRVGVIPLTSEETGKNEWFFKQNPRGRLFRTRGGTEEIPSGWNEVSGLERAAVWGPSHVEDRLRDHFEGRPNKWVESLKPKHPE